jgi:hypothetical protein
MLRSANAGKGVLGGSDRYRTIHPGGPGTCIRQLRAPADAREG